MGENIIVRKANRADIDAVSDIYGKIHTAEEEGRAVIGWQRGIYPERETALAALDRGDLFVLTLDGDVSGTAILNHLQVDVYKDGRWRYPAPDDEVMVMHTLVVDPDLKGHGLGSAFESFYERYALENGCKYLRIDTNAKNNAARAFYKKLGYEEIGIIPCSFNGLEGVDLVLLEKYLG